SQVCQGYISSARILYQLRRICLAHLYLLDFLGTLAPFFLASESPIAIACLRLFTFPPFPPFPDRNVPFFLRLMALATVLPAAFPYFLPEDFLRDLFLLGIHNLLFAA